MSASVAQAALVQAISTLKPEGVKALSDAIMLIQQGQDESRRSVEAVVPVSVGERRLKPESGT